MWCHVGFRRIFRCQSRRVLGDNSTTNGHTIDNDTELELDAVKTDNFALTRKIYVVDGHRPWNLDNLFGSAMVVCLDNGYIDGNLNEEKEAYNVLVEMSDSEDEDEDEGHNQNGHADDDQEETKLMLMMKMTNQVFQHHAKELNPSMKIRFRHITTSHQQ